MKTNVLALSAGILLFIATCWLLSEGYREAFSYIIRQDFLVFEAIFNRWYHVAYFVVRIMPALFTILFIITRLHKVTKRMFPDHTNILYLTFIYFSVFLSFELILQLKFNLSPGTFYPTCKKVSTIEDWSIQYSDTNGIIRFTPLNRNFPAFYNYINRDGFRSKYPFSKKEIDSVNAKSEKVIMFIGDSFTEGATAIPRDSCFVDLVDSHPGFLALNFGQGGTDPLQYRLVAESYIPQLKPDAVVMVLSSNDIMQYQRIPTPGIPIYYQTNASFMGAWLEAQKPLELGYQPNDVLKTKEEAYQFYVQYFSIPETTFINKLMAKSSLLTQVWKLTHKVKVVPDKEFKNGLPYTYNELIKVKTLCDSQNIPLLFYFIPNIYEIESPIMEIEGKYGPSFRDLPVKYVLGLSAKNDYVSLTGDTHFNNSGHRKFANQLITDLEKLTP